MCDPVHSFAECENHKKAFHHIDRRCRDTGVRFVPVVFDAHAGDWSEDPDVLQPYMVATLPQSAFLFLFILYTSPLHSAHLSASTCHRCTNVFALAQGCHKNKVASVMVRSTVFEDRGSSSSSSSSRLVNRHGRHRTYAHIPAAIENGK